MLKRFYNPFLITDSRLTYILNIVKIWNTLYDDICQMLMSYRVGKTNQKWIDINDTCYNKYSCQNEFKTYILNIVENFKNLYYEIFQNLMSYLVGKQIKKWINITDTRYNK